MWSTSQIERVEGSDSDDQSDISESVMERGQPGSSDDEEEVKRKDDGVQIIDGVSDEDDTSVMILDDDSMFGANRSRTNSIAGMSKGSYSSSG